jgi:methylenetetrahydrofolate reductase (NADPH)
VAADRGGAAAASPLAAFMQGWSLEATHPTAAEIAAVIAAAPAGTRVYLSAPPRQSVERVLEAVARLVAGGLAPVPHLAARHFAEAAEIEDFLRRLGDAGVAHVLVLAGDRDVPAGTFADAAAVIRSGLLQRHGIRRIGISGYPEGHPRIPDPVLARAQAEKLAAAAEAGLAVEVVTQFCFDPDAVVRWVRGLRAGGLDLPLRIGIAGPAGVASLLRYAARCGVRASALGLARNIGGMRAVVGQATPDLLLRALSEQLQGLGPVTPHFYSFGGVAQTARYAAAA